jgi:hypothetical protein
MSFSKIKLKTGSYEDLGCYLHYHYYYINNQLIKSLNKVVKR